MLFSPHMTRIRVDDHTEVQEPVLSEKNSCLKGGCFSSCGCLLMVGILLLLILRITWGPRTLNLSQLPTTFPAQELVYESSALQRIKLTRAADANRLLSTTTALPRLVYVPTYHAITARLSDASWWQTASAFAKQVRMIFLTPGSADSQDVYALTWGHLDSDIAAIRQFYVDAFSGAGFFTNVKFDNTNTLEIAFSRSDMSGTLLVENYDLRDRGIERMTLEVHVPHQP